MDIIKLKENSTILSLEHEKLQVKSSYLTEPLMIE